MGQYASKEWLYSAIEAHDVTRVREILKINPHFINEPMTKDCKTTPLSRAVWRGALNVVNTLIDLGADVNLSGPRNFTPLMWACVRGHSQIAELLVQKGARADVVSEDGLNPLDYCVMHCNYDIALMLVKDANLNIHARKADDYRQVFQEKKNYPFCDYDTFLEHLELKIPSEQCPRFNIPPPAVLPPKLVDPVIDPRETWGQFFNRVMNFEPPPLIERSELPANMQPQNRAMGRLREWLNLRSIYTEAPQASMTRSHGVIPPNESFSHPITGAPSRDVHSAVELNKPDTVSQQGVDVSPSRESMKE